MPVRMSEAVWEGDLKDGKGNMRLGSGAWQGSYSFASRFQEAGGTNPEELIGAAHAGCFSMALSHGLSQAGHVPTRVRTSAKVHLEKAGEGFRISQIDLTCDAEVPGIDQEAFQKFADDAKQNCPVSKLVTGAKIQLEAKLVK
jgi:osmotically inducible protein OsmC